MYNLDGLSCVISDCICTVAEIKMLHLLVCVALVGQFLRRFERQIPIPLLIDEPAEIIAEQL